MARAGGLKYCHVCRARYRGLYGVHTTTKRHRLKVHRANEGPTRSRRKLRSRHGVTLTALRRDYQGEDHERVTSHRRSPPDDGNRKIVKVRGYWRWLPWQRRPQRY